MSQKNDRAFALLSAWDELHKRYNGNLTDDAEAKVDEELQKIYGDVLVKNVQTALAGDACISMHDATVVRVTERKIPGNNLICTTLVCHAESHADGEYVERVRVIIAMTGKKRIRKSINAQGMTIMQLVLDDMANTFGALLLNQQWKSRIVTHQFDTISWTVEHHAL